MDQAFLIEFGVVLIAAAGLGILARIFKQPLILAYLIAGILIGPLVFGLIKDTKMIEGFASIGIVFLLFLVGLELNPRKLLEIGSSALTIGGAQILISGLIYFVVAKLLNFTGAGTIYLAAALTFSSTAIIVTLLSDKRDLDSLHGKILVGILLIQDFVALLLLTIFSGMSKGIADQSLTEMILSISWKTIVLFVLTFICGKYLFPIIFRRIARSQELLFITSLAWCFSLVIISTLLGFSAEVGAFLAGISLASLPYSGHIAAKARPLRDFFITIFFIYLGTNLIFDNFALVAQKALVFSVFIIIVNPIIIMLVMSLLGYRKRTNFLTGISLTQVSEFSFLVVALGIKLNILPKDTISLVSTIAIITVFISTYLISHSSKVYQFLRPVLGLIESKKKKDELYNVPDELSDHIILVGFHRTGSHIYEELTNAGEKVVVVDFDPRHLQSLIDVNKPCIYGDAIDHELLEKLKPEKAKMLISTINKYEENRSIIETYRKINKKLQIIMTADENEDALDLYEHGADLVILPTLISGEYISYIIKQIGEDKIKIGDFKDKVIKAIKNHQVEHLFDKYKTEALKP